MKKYSYQKPLLLFIVAIVDILATPIAYLLRRKKVNVNINPKRALLINPGGIGDIVLMEPLIRVLKLNFPHLKIDVLLREEVRDIATLIKGVDEVIALPVGMKPTGMGWLSCFLPLLKKIKKRYEIGFDIKGDPFSILLMTKAGISYRAGFTSGGLGSLLHYSLPLFQLISKATLNVHLAEELCQRKIDDFSPCLQNDVFKTSQYQALYPEKRSKKVISVVMATKEDAKLWPKNYWQELITLLSKQFLIILLDDKKVFWDNNEVVNMTGLSLLQSIAVVQASNFFIGLDSGLSHVASGYRIPTLCIFSLCHDPKMWGPVPSIIKSFTPPDSLDLNPRDVYNEVIKHLGN